MAICSNARTVGFYINKLDIAGSKSGVSFAFFARSGFFAFFVYTGGIDKN